jgi:hypothetical protein
MVTAGGFAALGKKKCFHEQSRQGLDSQLTASGGNVEQFARTSSEII